MQSVHVDFVNTMLAQDMSELCETVFAGFGPYQK